MFAKPLLFVASVCLLVVLAACGGDGTSFSGQSSQVSQPVTVTRTAIATSGWYPRVIRLSHGPAATDGTLIASTGVGAKLGPAIASHPVFRSVDNGASFTHVGDVNAVAGSSERCCSTLFELPTAVGALPAGTLLSAGSYYSGSTPAIELYVSRNQGAKWDYYGTPAIRGKNRRGGLWEPEFAIARDGALVLFWSDETDPCCSQKLVQMRTYDGKTWQDESDTVASTVQSARPGMARVSALPGGRFFMSYEICGPQQCAAYSRTSADGWNFGAPSNPGSRIVSTTGQYFEHAPDSAWSSQGGGNGTLLAVGQVLHEADGSVSGSNGQVLFVNTSADGSGSWSVKPAPVPVPGATSNDCTNYADTLLPSADGAGLLEIAADFDAGRACRAFVGALPRLARSCDSCRSRPRADAAPSMR